MNFKVRKEGCSIKSRILRDTDSDCKLFDQLLCQEDAEMSQARPFLPGDLLETSFFKRNKSDPSPYFTNYRGRRMGNNIN